MRKVVVSVIFISLMFLYTVVLAQHREGLKEYGFPTATEFQRWPYHLEFGFTPALEDDRCECGWSHEVYARVDKGTVEWTEFYYFESADTTYWFRYAKKSGKKYVFDFLLNLSGGPPFDKYDLLKYTASDSVKKWRKMRQDPKEIFNDEVDKFLEILQKVAKSSK